MSEYTFVLHQAEEGGYWVEVPALPGCLSQGETMEQAIANVREAIETHLAALEETGEEVPLGDDVLIGRVAIAR